MQGAVKSHENHFVVLLYRAGQLSQVPERTEQAKSMPAYAEKGAITDDIVESEPVLDQQLRSTHDGRLALLFTQVRAGEMRTWTIRG